MKTEFFAQIFTPTTVAGQWEAGTAYPIAKDLLITARHVLYPELRDETKLRQVEWSDYKDVSGQKITSDITRVVFDGGKDLDIAIVACQTPPEINSFIKLSERDPIAGEEWDSFGYPKIGEEGRKGIRKKMPIMGEFLHPDNHHELDLKFEEKLMTPQLWQGLSGAAGFSRTSGQLMMVIISMPTDLNRLYAVSIPYLLRKSPDFKKAAGYPIDADTTTNLLPDVKLGENFKAFLRNQISAELKLPEAKYLNEQLAELFNHDKREKNLETLITNSLLSNQIDKAIGDYLTLAASDCISPKGCRFHEVSGKLDKVREIAEQILGWLVLASIDENKIQQILPNCEKHKSYYFSLAVNSIAGVEIVLSRRFDRKVTWTNKDKNSPYPTSPHRIKLDNSLLKWDDKETLRKILIAIWDQVFPTDPEPKTSTDELNQGEIDLLNETLEILRDQPRDKEHYYIAFKLPEASPEFIEKSYLLLLKCLPQITMVQFGIENSDSLFVIPEVKITARIGVFYRKINS